MKNENYDYQCPRCATRNITFKDIHNDKLVFFCSFCDEDFITTDRESKYIHRKIASLRWRYPQKKKGGVEDLRR